MNQSNRMGWPGLAQFIADEYPSGRVPCVTPRRVDETEFFRATQRALDKPPAEVKADAPAKATPKFKVGDRVRKLYQSDFPEVTVTAVEEGYEYGGRIVTRIEFLNGDSREWSEQDKLELIPTESPDADGWVTWGGGVKSPVRTHCRIDVRLRDGRVLLNLKPGFYWQHVFGSFDTVAYRVVKP